MKRWRWLFLISLALMIGGAVVLFEPPRRLLTQVVSTYPISSLINRLQRISIPANDAACLEELKGLDVDFKRQADFSEPQGCNIEYAVRLSRVGNIKLDNSPLLTCSMAIRLAEFEQAHIQPAAEAVLGAKIKRIKHIGTYNCRSMRQYSGVLSQHAFANAIDVSGFELTNGQTINVAKDWNVAGAKSEFLRRISSNACDAFRVAVSPDGDANHWNHLHWDMGAWGSCR
jgi:hypothetical protein